MFDQQVWARLDEWLEKYDIGVRMEIATACAYWSCELRAVVQTSIDGIPDRSFTVYALGEDPATAALSAMAEMSRWHPEVVGDQNLDPPVSQPAG